MKMGIIFGIIGFIILCIPILLIKDEIVFVIVEISLGFIIIPFTGFTMAALMKKEKKKD